MSDDYQRIELITGAVRRRHWTTEQKLQIIEESFQLPLVQLGVLLVALGVALALDLLPQPVERQRPRRRPPVVTSPRTGGSVTALSSEPPAVMNAARSPPRKCRPLERNSA